uniref:hypothetical protein n=1 Tax=Paenibacillus humicola TaxID=3110540 RepID=UPI00237AC84D
MPITETKIKVSAWLKLSSDAAAVWDGYKNKSELVNQAVEFYTTHGQKICASLEEIKSLLKGGDRRQEYEN